MQSLVPVNWWWAPQAKIVLGEPTRFRKPKPALLQRLFGKSFHHIYETLARLLVQTWCKWLPGFPKQGTKTGLPTACRTMAYQLRYLWPMWMLVWWKPILLWRSKIPFPVTICQPNWTSCCKGMVRPNFEIFGQSGGYCIHATQSSKPIGDVKDNVFL